MKTKLQPLDVVQTKFGTLAVVHKRSDDVVCITLPKGSTQKYAWYTDEELIFVAPLWEIVAGWIGSK